MEKENNGYSEKQISRGDFIKNTALATAGFYIVPRHVLGRGYTAPSDKLYIAAVGCGGVSINNFHQYHTTAEKNVAGEFVLVADRGKAATQRKKVSHARTCYGCGGMYDDQDQNFY